MFGWLFKFLGGVSRKEYLVLQAKVQRPELQTLLDEYYKYGGSDSWRIRTDRPGYWRRVATEFEHNWSKAEMCDEITRLKAKWADKNYKAPEPTDFNSISGLAVSTSTLWKGTNFLVPVTKKTKRKKRK